MMKQMYVVKMMTGSYGDYNVEVVAVTEDFEKGSAYVEKMNSVFKSLAEKIDLLHRSLVKNWQQDNPSPIVVNPALIPIQKWSGSEKITKEMREERKRVQLMNSEMQRLAQEPYWLWMQQRMDFIKDWEKKNLTEDEYEMRLYHNENRWEIEPVNWL